MAPRTKNASPSILTPVPHGERHSHMLTLQKSSHVEATSSCCFRSRTRPNTFSYVNTDGDESGAVCCFTLDAEAWEEMSMNCSRTARDTLSFVGTLLLGGEELDMSVAGSRTAASVCQ